MPRGDKFVEKADVSCRFAAYTTSYNTSYRINYIIQNKLNHISYTINYIIHHSSLMDLNISPVQNDGSSHLFCPMSPKYRNPTKTRSCEANFLSVRSSLKIWQPLCLMKRDIQRKVDSRTFTASFYREQIQKPNRSYAPGIVPFPAGSTCLYRIS